MAGVPLVFPGDQVTDQRFNQLVNGPLFHPIVLMMLNRLMIALRVVVEATGAAGDRALEAHCALVASQDSQEEQDGEA